MTGAPRVAYVLKMFPRYSETFVINEILELERRGHSLVIYSLKPPAGGPRHDMLNRLEAPVVYLPQSPWRGAPVLALAHGRLLARAPLRYLAALGRILARMNWSAFKRFLQSGVLVLDAERRGVRHLHAHFATSATRVSMLARWLSPGLTYSFTAHAKDIFLDGQDVPLLRDKIAGAEFVITVSDFNVRHLRALCGPVTEGRVVRLYNGVDTGRISVSTEEREEGLVLCVARLVEKKGVSDLLKALAALQQMGTPFTCRVIGDGSLREALIAQSRELGISDRVQFPGALSHEGVVRELARARVLALPCIIAADGNRDGLPTVILEAMATGTPVVSTRVTGIPEMVEDGRTGYIVDPGRPAELARALQRILADPDLSKRMGQAGRSLVEARFDLRKNAGELGRRLASMASSADGAAPEAETYTTSDGAPAVHVSP